MISTQTINECLSGSEAAIQALVRSHQREVFQLALSILDCSDAPLAESSAQAEIATRDTFVTALDRLGRYRVQTPFNTWLFRIAIETSRRRARAWQRERSWQAFRSVFLKWVPVRKREADQPAQLLDEKGPEPFDHPAANALPAAGQEPAADNLPAAHNLTPLSNPELPLTDFTVRARSEEALWQSVRALDEKLRLPVVLRYYHDFPVAEIARLLRLSEGAVHARLDQAREKIARQSATPDESDLEKNTRE